jgi:hypothetical protein
MAGVPPPLVALFPGETVAAPLNLINDDRDIKMYHRAIVGITKPYDMKPKGLKNFLLAVKERSRLYNWGTILDVPDALGNTRSLLEQYGNVDMEDCQIHANDYMMMRQRDAQNSMMLYQFLSNSISDEVKSELTVQSEMYEVQGQFDGICFLKLIVSTAQVDTIATVSVLRSTLKRLDVKMVELSGNLIDFHTHVRETVGSLAAYGEVMQNSDLLTSLFEAYEAVEDEKFQQYIAHKQIAYEEGLRYTPNQIMQLAETHYRLRVEAGKWKSPTKKDIEITALRVQIDQIQNKAPVAMVANTKAPYNANDPKHAWKKVPPTTNETTKVVDKKTWNWCRNHKAWGQHTYESCRGVTIKKDRTTIPNSNNTTQSDQPTTPEVQVNSTLTSIIEEGAIRLR